MRDLDLRDRPRDLDREGLEKPAELAEARQALCDVRSEGIERTADVAKTMAGPIGTT